MFHTLKLCFSPQSLVFRRFTPDVAMNSDVFLQGEHYGVPGIKAGLHLNPLLTTSLPLLTSYSALPNTSSRASFLPLLLTSRNSPPSS